MDAHSYGKAIGGAFEGGVKLIITLGVVVFVLMVAVIVLTVRVATEGKRLENSVESEQCEQACLPNDAIVRGGECHCLVSPESL